MDLINLVKDAVIDASTNFREDQLTAYKMAVETETNPNARWVLELLLKNAEIASSNKVPLCDDTGVPHVLIEVGREANLAPGFFEDINKGIEAGLKELPARPMAVKGNSIERIEQSQGLYKQPEMLPPTPFSVTGINGDVVKIHVLMLGGGPEIRAHTYKVFHKRDHRKVFLEVLTWLRSEIAMLGCTPCIPAIGIGRTHFEASSLMLKAMAYGNLNIQSELENCLTGKLNNTNIGSLGIGGSVTALGSFIEVGPQRASGVRVVSMRPCCCVEPRRSTVQLSKFLE